MNGPVSSSLWIYFVLTLPLTILVVGAWWKIDQRKARKAAVADSREDDEERMESEEEKESRLLESRIMRNIRRRTGIKVADTFGPQQQAKAASPARQSPGHISISPT